MEWVTSFAHPSVARQMLHQMGENLIETSLRRRQLSKGSSAIFRRIAPSRGFLDLMSECGWETQLIQEANTHIDYIFPICPFGNYAVRTNDLCTLHASACGQLAVSQFGYAKINLQKGTGSPPENCSLRIFHRPSPESEASGGHIFPPLNHNSVSAVAKARDTFRAANLTPRELEILLLVGEALTDMEIASALRLSVRTVGNVLGRVRDKLGIRRRGELARFVFDQHLNAVQTPQINILNRSKS